MSHRFWRRFLARWVMLQGILALGFHAAYWTTREMMWAAAALSSGAVIAVLLLALLLVLAGQEGRKRNL